MHLLMSAHSAWAMTIASGLAGPADAEQIDAGQINFMVHTPDPI